VNIIDRAVAWIDPQRGLKRAQMRRILAQYDGAEINRRTSHWRRPRTDANGAFLGKLVDLQTISRDLTRNNPMAARALEVVTNNTIGTGIVPKIKPRPGARPKEDDVAKLNEVLKNIAESTQLDADGMHNLCGLQRLIMRTTVESGECLIRRRWRRPSDGLRVPFQIQVLEPDYLDTTKDGPTASGGVIVQGVEFDVIGRRVAYHLYPMHPGATWAWRGGRFTSSRIDASEVAHVLRVDRPGQVRGVPWVAPAMIKIKDAGEYDDAQLMRQKIAACYAVFIHGGQAADPVSDVSPESADRLESIAPGIVEYVPDGQNVSFANPPNVDGYTEVMRISERRIAAAYGITYEALSGDYGNVNFSSGRMGWIEMARNVDSWRWNMFIPQFCARLERWFLDAYGISDDATAQRKYTMDWTAPHREMIDPAKELKAFKEAIRSGLMSWQEVLRMLGYDPVTVAAEIKEDQSLWDQLGVSLDCDPRRPSAGGDPVVVQADPQN
jgi:lambda family phage portal protein